MLVQQRQKETAYLVKRCAAKWRPGATNITLGFDSRLHESRDMHIQPRGQNFKPLHTRSSMVSQALVNSMHVDIVSQSCVHKSIQFTVVPLLMLHKWIETPPHIWEKEVNFVCVLLSRDK